VARCLIIVAQIYTIQLNYQKDTTRIKTNFYTVNIK